MRDVAKRIERRVKQGLRALRPRRRSTPPADGIKASDAMGRILQSPPVPTGILRVDQEPESAIGIHILGQDDHLLQAMWAVKSFYHFAGVGFPLTVHLQGTNTRKMQSTFQAHFPQARLIRQESADAVVEPWLRERGLHRLSTMRRQLFLMMKLVDLHVFARTPLVLYLDTDVLFFRHPDELLAIPGDGETADHLFMRDDHPSYCISPEQARLDLGVDLIPFANAGMMRLASGAIDLVACERYMAHPSLAKRHWHLDQTLHALYASSQCRLGLLPGNYAMSKGLDSSPDLVARHYTSPIRPLLANEGVAHLMDNGFLEAIGSRSDGVPIKGGWSG